MRSFKFAIFLFVLLLYKVVYAQNFSPEYLGSIQQKVGLNYIYPKEAYSQGWEGVVKVRFILTPDGQVKKIDIAQSSGYPLLDDSAIAAVKNASPYPFPKNVSGELEILLPIAYQRSGSQKTVSLPSPAPQKKQTVLPEQKPQAQPDTKNQITSPSQAQPPTPPPPKTEPAQAVSTVSIQPKTGVIARSAFRDEAIPPPHNDALTTPPETKPLPQERAPLDKEVSQFIDLALKNNQPTRVAREEVELAQMKVTEAKRNFFPGVKLTAYSTSGEVFKVDYEERETKMEVSQPLYYGGRLGDTYNQAVVNYEITQKNYDRLKFDVMQKTETAYYNLVAARTHVALKEDLMKEGRELLGKIEKLGAIGMLIPLEVTSARSWYKQMELQMNTLRQEIYMAELTLKQVLNTNDPVKIEAVLPDFKAVNLDLLACQQAAIRSRPEVNLSKLLVKFNEYGQKIEKSKSSAFTVDFTSSFGKYSGHYLTEPWRDASNWFIGFKASKPWGASTFNGNWSNDHAAPRFGQYSGTDNSTYSGEALLFDNYKRITDKKRSDIDLHRSVSDFNETIKTITFEVRDALFNYQKAASQLEAAQVDMQYRRDDVEITKIRSMVGEAAISSAMESLFHLSDAQTRYIQALANCQISLATLKKACGYGLTL